MSIPFQSLLQKFNKNQKLRRKALVYVLVVISTAVILIVGSYLRIPYLLFYILPCILPSWSVPAGLIIGSIGAVISFLSWRAASRADKKTGIMLESYIFQASGFRQFADTLTTRILTTPKDHCEIKLALMSPAFGALQLTKGGAFIRYKNQLKKLSNCDCDCELSMLFLDPETQIEWYKKMYFLFHRGSIKDYGIKEANDRITKWIKQCSLDIQGTLDIMKKWIKKRNSCFRTTRDIPFQTFLRIDGCNKTAMYGLMGSNYAATAMNIPKWSYNEIEAFTTGFLSSAVSFTSDYEAIFEFLWEASDGQKLSTEDELTVCMNRISNGVKELTKYYSEE